MKIGDQTFDPRDQQFFAAVSLDWNPMHVDPVAARRLATGRQVVHGIHLLLSALERWRRDPNQPLPVFIDCTFHNPVSVGDRVTFTQLARGEHECAIEMAVDGLLCSRVTVSYQPAGPAKRFDIPAAKDETHLSPRAQPLDEPPASQVGRQYVIQLNTADFSGEFPQSHRLLGKERFAAVCALSYFVGMVCPGLHSMFFSLRFDLTGSSQGNRSLLFVVRKYDQRVGLFEISFHGCIEGVLKAFVRPPSQLQPSLAELERHVVAGEFRGTRSLIIGGSRGLGEITAKILAAGGGDVVVSYASGAEDARMVCDEINSAGKGRCETVKFELTVDTPGSMNVDCSTLDAVYFFATPRIFRKKAETFMPSLFREFSTFYVEKFHELCAHLQAAAGTRTIRVFFPSSIAVAERPRGMTEYSMAKAAAEILIEDINKAYENVSIICTRLPRLNTDQTATLLRIASESNLATMIPIIRSMQGRATPG